MSLEEVFRADLERMNAALEGYGAVVTLADGFVGIDQNRAPEGLIRAYAGLVSFGYANGLL